MVGARRQWHFAAVSFCELSHTLEKWWAIRREFQVPIADDMRSQTGHDWATKDRHPSDPQQLMLLKLICFRHLEGFRASFLYAISLASEMTTTTILLTSCVLQTEGGPQSSSPACSKLSAL